MKNIENIALPRVIGLWSDSNPFNTLKRTFLGAPKSDRIITFHETDMMRIQNGKMIENIVSATNLEFEMLMAPVQTPLCLR